MNYVFKGNLRGFYCGDCFDYLYKANVRIYAVDKAANVTALAVANEKDTFHQRTGEELKAISKRLIAEAATDEMGNFSIDLRIKITMAALLTLILNAAMYPLSGPKIHPGRPAHSSFILRLTNPYGGKPKKQSWHIGSMPSTANSGAGY